MEKRVAESFLGAVGEREFSEETLRQWVGILLHRGTSEVTVRRYLGKLRTLYGEFAPDCPDVEIWFNTLRQELKSPELYLPPISDEIISAVRAIALRVKEQGEHTVVAKTLIYLLLTASESMSEAVNLRFEEYTSLNIPQADAIVESQHEPRRKFVFPLGQGKKRPAQILRELSADIAALLFRHGVRLQEPFSSDTLRGIWIEYALRAGVPFGEIRSVIHSLPRGYQWLKLITPVETGTGRRSEILKEVAGCISPDTTAWYAMHLRTRSAYEEILSRLADRSPEIEFYYPQRQAVRRKGKKMVSFTEPYIPDVLFFRTRRDMIRPMFAVIGDLAYCFRVTNTPEAPYSVIPRGQMEEFQRFIGIYSPDITLDLIPDDTFAVGDRAMITGGLAAGQQGEIIEIVEPDGSRTLRRQFLLRISAAGTLRCIASADGRNLKRVE